MLALLAQIGTDTNQDIIADFLGQLPVSLLLFVCGSTVLLFVAFAWFAYFKPLFKKRRDRAQSAAPVMPSAPPAQAESLAAVDAVPITPPPTATEDETDGADDLPDLDMLISAADADEDSASLPVIPSVPEPAPPPETPPAPMRDRRQYRVELHTGGIVRAEELIAVLRDPRDGRLMVQIDGVAYRTLTASPDAKREFVELMRELSTTVEQPDDDPPPIEEAPITPAEYVPGKLPSYKLEDHMKPTGKGVYEVGDVPELNLAEAIEAYLQHKRRQTPEYATRAIHIHPAPDGGVRIQVDDRYYEAVSDVEDQDVRLFIQQAIAEWQKYNN